VPDKRRFTGTTNRCRLHSRIYSRTVTRVRVRCFPAFSSALAASSTSVVRCTERATRSLQSRNVGACLCTICATGGPRSCPLFQGSLERRATARIVWSRVAHCLLSPLSASTKRRLAMIPSWNRAPATTCDEASNSQIRALANHKPARGGPHAFACFTAIRGTSETFA
jgi:hypothetical protein